MKKTRQKTTRQPSAAKRRAVPGQGSGPTNLLTSVVLVLPLLLFYEIGVIFTNALNGADFFTRTLIRWVGFEGFLWTQGGLALLLVLLLVYLRRTQRFELRRFAPVVFESAVYALTMGTLIVFVMVEVFQIDPRLATPGSPLNEASLFQRLVLSVGAGVHEELVFRLFLLTGLALLLERGLGFRRWVALGLAMLASSLLFSAAHHVGPLGEPLRIGAFVYRTLAGLVFATLYQQRGFAIAVYTHALYDIYVLLLL